MSKKKNKTLEDLIPEKKGISIGDCSKGKGSFNRSVLHGDCSIRDSSGIVQLSVPPLL
jgi:hypothetical protein